MSKPVVFHDKEHYRIHESLKHMLATLLKLEDEEIIKLYDAVVHNYKEDK